MSSSKVSQTVRALALTTACLTTTAGITALSTTTAQAAESGRFLTISLVGDSYTAGNGAGSYYNSWYYRSSRNWGHSYAQWLNDQGIRTVVHNYAVSGAVTKDMLTSQVPQVDPTSDLVMLTAGGNDVGFSKIVTYCYAAVLVNKANCTWALDNANSKLAATRANLSTLLSAIAAKVKPGARIVLVGYPLLNVSYADWKWDAGTSSELDVVKEVRKLGTNATAMQADVVAEWNRANASRGVSVTFVPTQDLFDTADGREHGVNPEWGEDNPYRWINGLQETEGKANPFTGVVTAESSKTDMMNWYHPNITGHAKIGELLAQKIGVPTQVRATSETRKNVDVMFLVDDSTASKDSFSRMKQEMIRLVNQYQADATAAGKQARFGLIVYHNGWGPYRWKTKQNLTGGQQQIINQINALKIDSYYSSGSWQLYDALNDSLKSAYETRGWNQDNRQVLYVLGNGNASGFYDWEEPARRAFANNTTEINVADIDSTVNPQLKSAAVKTGGVYYRLT